MGSRTIRIKSVGPMGFLKTYAVASWRLFAAELPGGAGNFDEHVCRLLEQRHHTGDRFHDSRLAPAGICCSHGTLVWQSPHPATFTPNSAPTASITSP